MQYFRNSELTKLYPVSEKAVRNWIAKAKAGRLELQLYKHEDKTYIANTLSNLKKIEQIVHEGKKYRSSRTHKTITPSAEFYKLYTSQQIVDIIANLDIHREIPRQYNYFDGGAEYWDKHVTRSAQQETLNPTKGTIQLLATNRSYLDHLLSKYKKVNVIDVGVGNALPSKDLLQHLLNQQKLGNYVAIDLSTEMLEIAERNIKEWFGDQVAFESYLRDISHDRFIDVLSKELRGEDKEDSVNLVLLLGSTAINFRSPEDPLKVVYSSMHKDDILIYTTILDTPASRRTFSFNTGLQPNALPPQYKFIVDLLQIKEEYYETDLGFDEERRERYLKIKLKVDLTLKFTFEDGEQTIDLHRNERILIWRAKHQNTLEVAHQLAGVGFGLLNISHTEDYVHMLAIASIRTDQEIQAK